jgi:hypothetical protein
MFSQLDVALLYSTQLSQASQFTRLARSVPYLRHERSLAFSARGYSSRGRISRLSQWMKARGSRTRTPGLTPYTGLNYRS